MDTLISSSSIDTSTTSITKPKKNITFGHVYFRPYARTISSCGIPEDITYSLALSNSIVLYNTEGDITGGYDPFQNKYVSIHIGSTVIPKSISSESSTSILINNSINNEDTHTSSTFNALRNSLPLSPLESTALTLNNSLENNNQNFTENVNSSSFDSSSVNSSVNNTSESSLNSSSTMDDHKNIHGHHSEVNMDIPHSSSSHTELSLFSQDSSFSSTDEQMSLSYHDLIMQPSPSSSSISSTDLNISSNPIFISNPPPRPLLSGEIYGGTIDEFDQEMTLKKQNRDNANSLPLMQRKRGRQALNVSSLPPALPWFGLNAKQRATRISMGVLANTFASISEENTEISNELRLIINSRKQSNIGCRCSLLASTELQPLPIKALRTECELRNLPSTGTKNILIARLIEHSHKNLGCIKKATLPTVILLKYLESYGPNPTKAQRNAAKRKTKEEIEYLKSHNYTKEIQELSKAPSTTITSDQSMNTTQDSSQNNDNSNDNDDTDSIDTESFLNDSENSDSNENNIVGDTEIRLQKAYKTAVKLSEILEEENKHHYQQQHQHTELTMTDTTTSSTTNLINNTVVPDEGTLTIATASHIQNTPVLHHGPAPGTLVPALDICPCAASGEGCHFNRCLCDPSLCDNRCSGDPGASTYDDIGIYLHRDLIHTLQSTTNEYFFTVEMIREFRAKQMLAMSRQVAIADDDEDDNDNNNGMEAIELLFGDHTEYLQDQDNDPTINNNDGSSLSSDNALQSSNDNSEEHLDTESDMETNKINNIAIPTLLSYNDNEFSREAANRVFALMTANRQKQDEEEQNDEEEETNTESYTDDKASVISTASSQLSHLGHLVSSNLLMTTNNSNEEGNKNIIEEETILEGPNDAISNILAHNVHHPHIHYPSHNHHHEHTIATGDQDDEKILHPSKKLKS